MSAIRLRKGNFCMITAGDAPPSLVIMQKSSRRGDRMDGVGR
jgi:hypothetical protein